MERSAFGVVHKRESVPDPLTAALPASSVKAYDNSRKHKLEAMTTNMGAKFGGAAVGGAAGLGLAALARKKIPALSNGLKFKVRPSGKERAVSGDNLHGWAQSMLAGSVGGAVGTGAGSYSLKRIKENPRYKYRRA